MWKLFAKQVLAAAIVLACGCPAWANFDVKVDLENVSSEAKSNWPVVLTVMQIFGRDLPEGSINTKGFHVFDPAGKEVEWYLEELPPYLHPGGYELVFVVPAMDKDAKATYRITNTADAGKAAKIDVVASPHNLVKNGGFEQGDGKSVTGFASQAAQDKQTKHSGEAAMLFAGKSGMKAAYSATIGLHKDSWYYAAVWSKTENIARHGTAAGDGGHFVITGVTPNPDYKPGKNSKFLEALESQNGAGISIAPTCYTRDWNKLRLCTRYMLFRDDWGIERNTAKATDVGMSLDIALDQKKQFWMENNGSGKWWLDDMVIMEQPKVAVRHDLNLEPFMKDGCFIYTRPTNTTIGDASAEATKDSRKTWGYCPLPYPHEAANQIDRFALKGQRANYLVGVYHTRAMDKVSMKVDGLAGPDGATLAPESVEVSFGVLGETPHYYLFPQAEPVHFAGPKGNRYFLATFLVPKNAKPGKYAGKLNITEGDKILKSVPISLAVQDIEQPVIKDRWIGSIFQAGNIIFTEETCTVFGREGFSCITVFGGFLKYKPGADGLQHVDAQDLAAKMGWLVKNGFAAVSLYSELQLDDKPRGPGHLAGMAYREAAADKSGAALNAAVADAAAAHKKARDELAADKTNADKAKAVKDAADKEAAARAAAENLFKNAYGRMIKELDAECKKHPEWPIIIHMNWDEPNGPNPKMAYSNEILPDVETTADLSFGVIPTCAKYFTIPCIDDPADCSGPDLYGWIKKQGKKVGIAASSRKDEFARYQIGLMVYGADISYLHSWHVHGLMSMEVVPPGSKTKKCLRSISLVGSGEGMDDLKAVTLLHNAIAKAKSGSDAALKAKAEAAQKFLDDTFKVFNGDHLQASGNPPYFYMPGQWGYDRYYDDFQKKTVKFAAELMGVKWVD
jgi:hypothetical protein